MDSLYNRVARRRHRGQQGFTLIELLVVIAVLAILATIVIFNVTGVVNRGSSAACVTDLKTVQTASNSYFSDNQKYATTGGGAGNLIPGDLTPNYMHTYPTDFATWTIDANGTVTNVCP